MRCEMQGATRYSVIGSMYLAILILIVRMIITQQSELVPISVEITPAPDTSPLAPLHYFTVKRFPHSNCAKVENKIIMHILNSLRCVLEISSHSRQFLVSQQKISNSNYSTLNTKHILKLWSHNIVAAQNSGK